MISLSKGPQNHIGPGEPHWKLMGFLLSEMESLEGLKQRDDNIGHQLWVRGAYEILVATVMI